MKKEKLFQVCLLSTLLFIANYCAKDTKSFAENIKGVYFTIDPNDPRMLVPTRLDDSIMANLVFDSFGIFVLDSSFCANHPNLSLFTTNDTLKQILAKRIWTPISSSYLRYENSKQPVKIGDTNLIYNNIFVTNFKKQTYNNKLDGIFNIPSNDTTHIWELNFEDNYLEVHSAINFQMPKNCFLFPMVIDKYNNGLNRIRIAFPMQIRCANGDTLIMNRTYIIDTGMNMDIVLMRGTEEQEFFNKKEEAVWTQIEHSYIRHYIVNATLFDNYQADSLRIYNFDRPFENNNGYLIGLNFLKRFNVFFDMKNNRIGLQPIKNFQRITGPAFIRFHYLTDKTLEKKYIVTKVADYATNYYKTAGLKEGDEIVAVNGLPYNNYAFKYQQNRDSLINEIQNKKVNFEDNHIFKDDTLIFEVVRQGKPMKIIVLVDKNEVQGD